MKNAYKLIHYFNLIIIEFFALIMYILFNDDLNYFTII